MTSTRAGRIFERQRRDSRPLDRPRQDRGGGDVAGDRMAGERGCRNLLAREPDAGGAGREHGGGRIEGERPGDGAVGIPVDRDQRLLEPVERPDPRAPGDPVALVPEGVPDGGPLAGPEVGRRQHAVGEPDPLCRDREGRDDVGAGPLDRAAQDRPRGAVVGAVDEGNHELDADVEQLDRLGRRVA